MFSVITSSTGSRQVRPSWKGIALTNDVEVMLGKVWVLLQEFADEDVGVLGCVCVIGDIV